eukprot:g7448.t1
MSETPQRGADRYQKIKDINSGSFGFVELAKDLLTGQNVAIKHIERGPKINKHVRNEIMNHRSLLHHHVIQFKECFLTDKHLCIVMEYAPGGDMLEFIRKRRGLNESEARWFFQQLIIGLDYCHRMGVASRDIKLENTLLDDSPWPMLKICDFGYSKHEQFNSAPVSRVGTPAYLAPEVITNKKDDQYDGKKADIWSCGVFLYVMLFSAYPFDSRADRGAHDKLQRMITRIVECQFKLPDGANLTAALKDLLYKILVKDPLQRISIEGIMKHPWFLKSLPQGALDMNKRMTYQRRGLQTQEEILELVEQAKIPFNMEDEELDLIDSELTKMAP